MPGLAAAVAFQAACEPRPYRAQMTAGDAVGRVQRRMPAIMWSGTYTKIGVSNRVVASLYALEHGRLGRLG